MVKLPGSFGAAVAVDVSVASLLLVVLVVELGPLEEGLSA